MEFSLVELHNLHDQISVLLVAFLILQGIYKYFDGKKNLMEKIRDPQKNKPYVTLVLQHEEGIQVLQAGIGLPVANFLTPLGLKSHYS